MGVLPGTTVGMGATGAPVTLKASIIVEDFSVMEAGNVQIEEVKLS